MLVSLSSIKKTRSQAFEGPCISSSPLKVRDRDKGVLFDNESFVKKEIYDYQKLTVLVTKPIYENQVSALLLNPLSRHQSSWRSKKVGLSRIKVIDFELEKSDS